MKSDGYEFIKYKSKHEQQQKNAKTFRSDKVLNRTETMYRMNQIVIETILKENRLP